MSNGLSRSKVCAVVVCLFVGTVGVAQEESAQEALELADGGRPATAALQRLIDESEGLVELPSGTFLLDAPLRVDLTALGYRGIRGAAGSTKLVMTVPGPALQIVGDHQGTAHPDSVEAHTWDKERFPMVSDIEILGAHAEADGIELRRTMKCTIRNVLIRRCRYGIHLVERNRNVIIADSHLYDGLDTGIFLDDCNLHQINILGNHISYNDRAGIRQYNGDVHNVQIAGNDIEYNFGSQETSGEIVLESPASLISEYSITGNTIQATADSPGGNIFILGSEENAPGAARTIVISGNVIGSREKNIIICRACRVTVTGNTIYGGRLLNLLVQQSRNIVFNGNNIGTRPSMHAVNDIYDDGVMFEGCEDCLFTSNIVSGHRFGDESRGGAVTMIDSRRCRIADCQILHPRTRGVHVVGGMGCVVSDNSIAAPSTEEFRAAIQVSGNGRAHLVQNNWISTALGNPIQIEGSSAEARNNTLVSEDQPVPGATP